MTFQLAVFRVYFLDDEIYREHVEAECENITNNQSCMRLSELIRDDMLLYCDFRGPMVAQEAIGSTPYCADVVTLMAETPIESV